ncbi:MAG: ABC transporter ATP-binding protein [Paracoccaceae bacterium]
MSVLDLRNVSIDFPTSRGVVHAVTDVTLSVPQGRRIGFIGESGSGKTTTALAAMRMLASPGFVSAGEIHLHSLGRTDLLTLSEEEMRRVRLRKIAYIPQGAMNSLNPVMRVEDQIWDGIVAHEGAVGQEELKRRSDAALASVGLDPAVVGRLYPHELSGGMKQRVCIAIGVCLGPDLIIADEPTSALDVITQRHVMQTLREVQAKIGAGLILIGHDMGLMAQSVDDIAVLKKGELVEFGPTRQIIERPQHPYTRELISSVPLVGGESFPRSGPGGRGPGGTGGPAASGTVRGFQAVWRGDRARPDEFPAGRGGAADHLDRRAIGIGQVHAGQPDAGLQRAHDRRGPVPG